MQIFLKKRRLPPSFDSPSIPSCPVGTLACTNFRSSDAQKQSLGATHVNIPAKGTMNGRMRFYSKKILAVHALVLVILGRECHSSLLALLGERRRRFGTRPRLLRRRPIPGIPAGSLHDWSDGSVAVKGGESSPTPRNALFSSILIATAPDSFLQQDCGVHLCLGARCS